MTEPHTILLTGGLVWQRGVVDIAVRDGLIAAVAANLPRHAVDEVVDVSGCVVYPGLVNVHHHLVQSIQKGIPAGIDLDLNGWLAAVPFACWPHVTPQTLYTAARIGFAELMRSGCTTCADHHYLYEETTSPEMEEALFQAVDETGIRFVLCRGGATMPRTHHGMMEAGIRIESLDTWLNRMTDTMARHHDASPRAMKRLVVAPTAIVHSTPPDHLRELAAFARSNGLRMHSHLLEVIHDEESAQAVWGKSAIDYAAESNWLGPDVWYAHLVHTDARAIAILGETHTGIAHCPVSNCRLGSGIAPVPAMERAGVRVGLGVDGSASAESGSMINETMLAWLIHRSVKGPNATKAELAVDWATRGGADILGLDVGRIETGRCADLAVFDLDDPRYFGVWDTQLSPVICGEPVRARRVMVNGRWTVIDGRVLGVDMDGLRRDAARELSRLRVAVG